MITMEILLPGGASSGLTWAILAMALAAWPAAACAGAHPLQLPPTRPMTNALPLDPLLLNAQGQAITTRAAWRKQREVIRDRWLDVLGPLPTRRPPLKAKILATEELAGFTRQHVQYQIEAGLFTDGYLLTPKKARGRLPAVVVFHPTTPFQARGVAGLESEYAEELWQGVQLVARGYIAWCPRNYINTEGADWAGNARKVLTAHPDWTGMTRMVWDAVRAADFLESLANVDRQRIGCLGHSLGGKQVLYAMAFDARYRAGVSSEGGIGLKFSNWDALWYLGPQIRRPDFVLENHQLLALVAPRPFLLLAGDSADGDPSWTFLETAWPVYRLLGAAENLGWVNHHGGHRYSPAARAAAEDLLARHLSPKASAPALEALTLCDDSPVDAALQSRLERMDTALRRQHGMASDATAVGLLDVRRQRLALIRPDREEYAASVPKIGILLAYFQMHPEAATHLEAQTRHDLGLMTKASDNAMATKFSRELGLREIQAVLNAYRFYDTNHGGGIWMGKHYGQGGERIGSPLGDNSHAATVRQLLRFFLRLEQGTLVSPAASRTMREIFASPDIPHDDIKFVRGLAGRDVQILRKWGSWQDWQHDCAVVHGPQRHYILVAMTKHPRGDDYLADLARAVDDLMLASPPGS